MKNQKIIDKNALFWNLNTFSGHELCVMLKANAYGHGTREIVQLLDDRVSGYGVVNAQEGKILRELTEKPILVCAREDDLKLAKSAKLDVIVSDEKEILRALENDLSKNLHLKIDCGMNRYGVKDIKEIENINEVLQKNKINLKSICTHFPNTENSRKTVKNYEIFLKKRKKIAKNVKICFGGSKINEYPFGFDVLRLGIGMYGYGSKNLQPVMRIVSHVCEIKFVERGECVGYGKRFKVKKSGFFAIVPIGYGDGLRRNLSGKFYVQIGENLYPSFGQICMDAFFVRVDATVKIGDEVVVMWNAEEMAEKVGTIPYEILTGFSSMRGETLVV